MTVREETNAEYRLRKGLQKWWIFVTDNCSLYATRQNTDHGDNAIAGPYWACCETEALDKHKAGT